MTPDVRLKELFKQATLYIGEPNPTVTLKKGYEAKIEKFFADWLARGELDADQRWWFEQTAGLLVQYSALLEKRAEAKGCDTTRATAATFVGLHARVMALFTGAEPAKPSGPAVIDPDSAEDHFERVSDAGGFELGERRSFQPLSAREVALWEGVRPCREDDNEVDSSG